jgi:hypothetical protein
VADWNRSFQNSKNEDKASGGGNYYLTMRSYLSDRYTKLAFGNYYRGTISIDQLAGYLGIKAKNVPTFEAHAFERRHG